jgi:hypothetical protein
MTTPRSDPEWISSSRSARVPSDRHGPKGPFRRAHGAVLLEWARQVIDNVMDPEESA